MFTKKIATISLVGFAATALSLGNPAFGQTVNQEINGSAVGPETSVNGSNLTINPTGKLNQLINCEAINYGVPLDPRCDANNTAIYGHGNEHQKPPHNGDNGGHQNHVPNVNQNVENGGTNTTVIAPATANSSSKSHSASSSKSNANATVEDSGNSQNTNLNVNQGGEAKIGDQKNQMSVTTGASSVSPSTKVKVDGDQYNSIQFGSQAPGTGGEAFSFRYRSACGTSVDYRQGFALKPRRIAGGGFGYALDVSNTKMDTIENRGSVQNKMNTAFQTAMGVVNNQQAFEQRLNNGGVSIQEAQTYAIANCTPLHALQETIVRTTNPPVDKPRNCTATGCN